MKVLVIEDDPLISAPLRQALEEAGHLVHVCRDGQLGLSVAQSHRFGLIILDLMLPGLPGLDICRELRQNRNTTPILILTARDEVTDRVEGLQAGADDYLGKPFELIELMARVGALERRNRIHKSSVIRVSDLEIDSDAHTVKRSGEPIALTSREFTLLEALAANEGRVVSRQVIIERVWAAEDISDNNLSVYVRLLRKKIDAGRPRTLIQTVVGVGYSLRSE